MSKKEKIDEISNQIKKCRKCPLWKSRTNAVPGDGDYETKILFIGEAPGHREDKKGLPFVGRAGKILDELLDSISLDRKKVYITNIVKCRPPRNRNPLKSEIKVCTPYLDKQLSLINPKIIVTLGNFATRYIFDKFNLDFEKISKTHGETFQIEGLGGTFKIMPVYHPAAATYDPNKKTMFLEDFKKLKEII
ncbi:MAG: type-4 uracil-DNA glycosylase [Candidatus Thermoplasmatota archaeon]